MLKTSGFTDIGRCRRHHIHNTDLIKATLGNACARTGDTRGILFHSDRGVQFSSNAYSQMLQDHGILPSMSRPGCPYDNSCVGGFFASLKKECLYKRMYDTMEEIERDLFESHTVPRTSSSFDFFSQDTNRKAVQFLVVYITRACAKSEFILKYQADIACLITE